MFIQYVTGRKIDNMAGRRLNIEMQTGFPIKKCRAKTVYNFK